MEHLLNQLRTQSQNFYNIWRLEPSRYQTTYFIMGHSFKDIICCIRIVGNLGSSVNSSSLPSWVCNYLRNYIRSQKDEDQIITWRKRVFGEHDLGTYKRACLFAPLDFTSYQKLQATPTGTEPTPPNFLRVDKPACMLSLCRQTGPKERLEAQAGVHCCYSQTHKSSKLLLP